MIRLALLALCCTVTISQAATSPLQGAGATFPAPLYTLWAQQYRAISGLDIHYDAVGSGEGIRRIESGEVNFGASDIPLGSEQLAQYSLTQFPAVVGGVVPVVNIDGIGSDELRLSGAILAGIYLGHIQKWNDPAIVALNPDLHLPRANITVVHRSDASGTTFLWSRFLGLSDQDWTIPAAATIAWPTGISAIGNEGVASMVQRTRMSMGYVEYAYARKHQLHVVTLRNRDGEFVKPGANSFRSAMDAAWRSGTDPHALLIDMPGANSWPITAASFVLLRTSAEAGESNLAILKFFDWALTQGQQAAVDLDYVPLPANVVTKLQKSWPPAALRSGH